jgi:hypothetical protein
MTRLLPVASPEGATGKSYLAYPAKYKGVPNTKLDSQTR